MGSFRPNLRRMTRRLMFLLLVTVVWSSFSVLVSTMLTTATLPAPEAEGVVANLKSPDTGFLWGVVIPVSFFLVIFTRPRRDR